MVSNCFGVVEAAYFEEVTSAFFADHPGRISSLTEAGIEELRGLLREFMEWLERHNGDLSALQLPNPRP